MLELLIAWLHFAGACPLLYISPWWDLFSLLLLYCEQLRRYQQKEVVLIDPEIILASANHLMCL